MRPSRLPFTIAIALAVFAGAAFATVAAPAWHIGAFAAAAAKPSPSASPGAARARAQAQCDAFVADLAKRLNTSPSNLQAQVKATIKDQVAQAVKDGKLTQAQADAITKKVDAAQGCTGLRPFAGVRPHGGRGMMDGLKEVEAAAAAALNVPVATLRSGIMSGKTLQQLAPAGTTQAQFDTKFKAELARALDPRVASKAITAAEETAEIDEAVKIADGLWSKPLPLPGSFAGKHSFGRPAPATAPTIQ